MRLTSAAFQSQIETTPEILRLRPPPERNAFSVHSLSRNGPPSPVAARCDPSGTATGQEPFLASLRSSSSQVRNSRPIALAFLLAAEGVIFPERRSCIAFS